MYVAHTDCIDMVAPKKFIGFKVSPGDTRHMDILDEFTIIEKLMHFIQLINCHEENNPMLNRSMAQFN